MKKEMEKGKRAEKKQEDKQKANKKRQMVY
jgi:hypothetical protein